MRVRRFIAFFLVCVTFGYTAVSSLAQPNQAAREEGVRNEVEGLRLYMHEYTPTEAARRPTFTVEAERGAQTQDQGGALWSLEGTRAVVYNEQGEAFTVTAARGTFDEANGVANLTGGVRVHAGEVVLELEAITWDNETREAHTNGPAVVTTGESTLKATGLVVKPEEEKIICRDTRGRIVFGEETP